MSKHRHKARGKVTQKMTRDGLVERNAATGEEERLSQRSADFDLRSAKVDGHALSHAGTRQDGNQSAAQRNRVAYKQAQETPTANIAEVRQDTPLQFTSAESEKTDATVIADVQANNESSDIPRQDEPTPLRQERGQYQKPPNAKPKPSHGKQQEYYQQFTEPKAAEAPINTPPSHITEKLIESGKESTGVQSESVPSELNTERESKLQTDTDSALRFSRDETPPQGKAKRPKPQYGKAEALNFDKPEKLHFTEGAADIPAIPVKPNQQRYTPPQSADVSSVDTAPVAQKQTGQAAPYTTPDAEIPQPETALKPARESKLHFKPDETPPETVKLNRKLEKAQRQADKSVEKLETAKSNLPTKKKLRSKTVVNEETGKPKRKLYFESEVKPQGEHIKGAKPLRPVKAAANSALMFGHTKMYQVEHENVSVKAAHRAEMFVEGGVRVALRRHKTAPYRKVEKLQRKAAKKSINLTYQKALTENPKLKGNPLSKAFQKRKIKRDYAKKVREAQKAAQKAKKAGTAAGNAVKAVAGAIKRHPVASAVVILVMLLMYTLMSLIGAFGSLGSGGIGAVAAGTFLAEDADILGAQAAYAGMEADLQNMLDNYESLNPGYDEYVYDLDSIWHDPYSLIAILSALHEGAWTLDEVQDTLAFLFERQYTLTETTTVEVRTRTETGTNTDPVTGETTDYDYEVEYNYYIRTVTLDNFNLSHLPVYIMGEYNLSRYALFMMTLGNRPDLFPVSSFSNASYFQDYGRHDVPQAYLDADPVFAAIITEAEKWCGMPYVWGGSSPSTSFDCSGFVSWVLNQSGWDIGRLGARALYNVGTPIPSSEAKPGDLIFFHSTYKTQTPGISHVGIYVGDGMMIHCGNPIGYVSVETSYWQAHFYGYARIY